MGAQGASPDARKAKRFADSKGPVERVLEIIQRFGSARAEWSLSDLAADVKLPRSTTHRLLKLMQQQGYVESDEHTRLYRPGSELYRIGAVLAANMPIIPLAMPILRDIVRVCDETALLSLYYPRQLQKAFVAQVESSRSMRYVIELNLRTPLLWGASAHAILAHLDADTIEQVLARRDPSPATATAPNLKTLQSEIARIRREGYAWSVGEGVVSAVGLAVPVFGADNTVKASLSVTYPEFRMDDALNRKLIVLLRDGAKRLSVSLGWGGGTKPSTYDLIKLPEGRPVMPRAARKGRG